jgi:hypothetical protein
MPSKHKITIATLTKLGADKLAELLLTGAAANKQLKQAIELAMSAKEGPEILSCFPVNPMTGRDNPPPRTLSNQKGRPGPGRDLAGS